MTWKHNIDFLIKIFVKQSVNHNYEKCQPVYVFYVQSALYFLLGGKEEIKEKSSKII